MTRNIAELTILNSSELFKVEKFIEEVCDYYHIGNEYFGNVMLGTTEAVLWLLNKNISQTVNFLKINAIKSNKGIKFVLTGGEINNTGIENEDSLNRAIENEKHIRELYIIKSLSDEMHLSADSQEITLVYYISCLDTERTYYRLNQLKQYFNKVEELKNENHA